MYVPKTNRVSMSRRVQRKRRFNAPQETRRKMMSSKLSKELRAEHSIRAFPVVTGDTVKVITGKYKGKTSVISKVVRGRYIVELKDISVLKPNGQSVPYKTDSSNLMLTKLDMSNSAREEALRKRVENYHRAAAAYKN